MKERRTIVLFDGVCNFCCGTVKFIIKRDPRSHFLFAPLQSKTGARILDEYKLPSEFLGSLVLIDECGCHTKSTAVLRIARNLTWPWNWCYFLRIIPLRIRDAIYNSFGNRRYRWFGKKSMCMVPNEDIRSRFLSS